MRGHYFALKSVFGAVEIGMHSGPPCSAAVAASRSGKNPNFANCPLPAQTQAFRVRQRPRRSCPCSSSIGFTAAVIIIFFVVPALLRGAVASYTGPTDVLSQLSKSRSCNGTAAEWGPPLSPGSTTDWWLRCVPCEAGFVQPSVVFEPTSCAATHNGV